MKSIHYPLLYYQLSPSALLGILVGTDYKLVGNDLKWLKKELTSYLQKQYKKYGDYWYMDMEAPRLKILDVKIRPTYRKNGSAYPVAEDVKIPVPVVFGQTEEGSYEAYLPLLGETIFYNDPRQFRSLVQYTATNILNRMPPSQLHRLMLLSEPQLDTISLRIKEDRKQRNWQFGTTRKHRQLDKLTVPFPDTKSVKRVRKNLPEAAWEMEKYIAELIELITIQRANVLLVGRQGVGKSAVLKQAIKKIAQQSRRGGAALTFWQLMSQRIAASAKYLGEWEQSCETLVSELAAVQGILWVVDMVRLIESGGSGPEDSVAAFFSGFLQQGKLQMLGEATPAQLESMRRLLPGFGYEQQT